MRGEDERPTIIIWPGLILLGRCVLNQTDRLTTTARINAACFELPEFLNILGNILSHMWNTYPNEKKKGGSLTRASERRSLIFEYFCRLFSQVGILIMEFEVIVRKRYLIPSKILKKETSPTCQPAPPD